MKYIQYIFSFFLVTMVSCGDKKEGTNSMEAETVADTKVVVTKAQFISNGFTLDTLTTRDFPEIVEATGIIDVPPQNKAIISATMGGFIKETKLLIGDEVKKGQALFTLENPDFVKLQQEYLENFKQLNYLKEEFNRQKTLYNEQITSQKNYLKAESDYQTTVARYNGLQTQLEMLNIATANVEKGIISPVVTMYAPISGSITRMNVSKGSYVSPTTEIMEIIDNEHIHLELMVFEKDILKIKKEQQILFKIPEASKDTFEANVHLVGTSIDNANRTIRVHGHLKDEEKNRLITGMFVDAKILVNSMKVSSLREEAVIVIDDESFALQLVSENETEYVFEILQVKTGNIIEGFIALEGQPNDATKIFLGKGAFNLLAEE